MAIKVKGRGKGRGKGRVKAKDRLSAEAARNVVGKEATDLGTPSDVVSRELVRGERAAKGGRKSSYQDTLPSRYKNMS